MKIARAIVFFLFFMVCIDGCLGASTTRSGKEESINASREARYTVLNNLALVLAIAGKPARVYFHGTCHMGEGGILLFPVVKVHLPTKNQKGLEAIRYMFSDDSNVVVSEDPSGLVRVRIGNVSTELLKTNLHSLMLSQLAQYNPNAPGGAIETIEDSETVKAAMTKLRVGQASEPMNVILQAPLETLPHLAPSMYNTTIEQLLDVIAKTFRGIVVYGECKEITGEGLIDIGFNWIPSSAN